MQFEYDPERLIEAVKKRPGIWDYNHDDYREKRTRLLQWSEVVKDLMPPGFTMTRPEQRELELQLQKKWKSVKDCFQKYVNNPKRTKRPYIYNKQLQFLLKYQNPALQVAQEEANSAEEEEREDKARWKRCRKLRISKRQQSSEEEVESETMQEQDQIQDSDEGIATISSRAFNDDDITSVSEFAFANVDTLPRDDDPDKMFLMSLLPHLKAIPEEFKLHAKMELMQVLQQANYGITKII